MATMINSATAKQMAIGSVGRAVRTEREQPSEFIRDAQYAFLSEVPGLVFAVMTAAWVVTSLVTL